MSYRPPPVPRKPASYSPSYLARQGPTRLEGYVLQNGQSPHEEDVYYDENDRDFALDQSFYDEPKGSSRPGSNGSLYGKPLPTPPGGHVLMPEPPRSGGYDRVFLDYDSREPSPVRQTPPYAHSPSSRSSIHGSASRRLSGSQYSPQVDGRSQVRHSSIEANRWVNTEHSELQTPASTQIQHEWDQRGYDYLDYTSLENGTHEHNQSRRQGSPDRAQPGPWTGSQYFPEATQSRTYAQYKQSRAVVPVAETYLQAFRPLSPKPDSCLPPLPQQTVSLLQSGLVHNSFVQPVTGLNYSQRSEPELPLQSDSSEDDYLEYQDSSSSPFPARRIRESVESVPWPLAVPPIVSRRRDEPIYASSMSLDPHSHTTVPNVEFSAGNQASNLYETRRPHSLAASEPLTTTHTIDPKQDHQDSTRYGVASTVPVCAPSMQGSFPTSHRTSMYQADDSVSSLSIQQIEKEMHSPIQREGSLQSTSSTFPLLSGHKRRISRSNTASFLAGTQPARKPIPHTLTSSSMDFSSLLPAIPKSFKKISSTDYETCDQTWSRSCVFLWVQRMGASTDVEFLQCLIGLFTHTVPTLSVQHVRKIASDLLASYVSAGEITKISAGSGSLIYGQCAGNGILPAFSHNGCYSPRCHTNLVSSRCYSSRCSRTIPLKLGGRATAALTKAEAEDWAKYWNLCKDTEPLVSMDKREIQRQYQIHEVIYSETDYLADLKILRDVFLQNLLQTGQTDQGFVDLVFGQISNLIKLSEGHLEPALKDRQLVQGPVIQNIGDIFLDWIKSARRTYVEYASQMRYADRAVRAQKIRSSRIRDWLSRCEADPRTKKLDFSSFQGSPTRRMQRYALLLTDVLKRNATDSVDLGPLEQAIDEIKLVCQECDNHVKIAQDKISLMDLNSGLIWKMPQKDLGLSDPNRTIWHRGELQRKSDSHTSWQFRDVILLDNFLISLKPSKDGSQKVISRAPIPVDYLVVDGFEEVLYKSSSSKLLGGTITHAVSNHETSGRRATYDTVSSVVSTTDSSVTSRGTASENLYPFTVRHAGNSEEKTTFYAESAVTRLSWIQSIFFAKSSRWEKVANREPFDVKVLADQAFAAYLSHSVQLMPDARPSNVIDARLTTLNGPTVKHISIARLQCSTAFRKSDGTEVFLLGTDDGVYSDHHDSSWTRLISVSKVTQIAVLEDFGTLLVLADKVLVAYVLDDLLNLDSLDKSGKKLGQRLSGNKDVSFFEVGVMKERLLVIYKKRENGNSVFKILEPVISKKNEKKSFFKKSATSSADSFREFDEFFIPAECYGMQYFRSTICIRCSRGFEILALDAKQPMTIPDLAGPHTGTLRSRIEGAKSLGTYRIQEGEFLCCFNECGLFVDGSGSVSRPYTLEWEGKPTFATLVGPYVVVIGKEFLEVWNVEKRSLRQVLTGTDIRLLPHSTAGSSIDVSGRGIVVAMNHPTRSGKQLVVELKLRKGL